MSCRAKIDQVWDAFWSVGISNPLEVIEQITHLMFLRQLEDNQVAKENKAARTGKPIENPIYTPDNSRWRWSQLIHLHPEAMLTVVRDEVFPWLRVLDGDDSTYQNHMKDARFTIPTSSLLIKVVDMLDGIPLVESDTNGDLYEYMLSKIAMAGQNGQFRTPQHIIQLIVEMMTPGPADEICDPACGTAGFLVAAAKYISRTQSDALLGRTQWGAPDSTIFHGFDFDSTMLRIASMNMSLHQVEQPDIRYRDSLAQSADEAERYSMILANPPFAGSLDYETTAKDLQRIVKTKKTELLFLALSLQLLKPGGRAAVIVPSGVLFGSSRAHKELRRTLIEEQKLDAVVKLPSGVFRLYASVSTAILFFTKTNSGGTDNVWFYEVIADGFSLDDKRIPLLPEDKLGVLPPAALGGADHEKNNLPDALARWTRRNDSEQHRARTEQSFCVSQTDIAAQNYDLSLDRYKEITQGEVTPIPAFGYAEYGDLDRYVREFVGDTPELDAAVSAGRLPFPPALAERSPDLAGLAARIWRLTSIDSPAYRRLFDIGKGLHDEPLTDAALSPGIEEHPITSTTSEGPPGARRHRSYAQAEGARLEQGMFSIFEHLFRIEADSWQAETSGARRPRAQVRRQRSGTQYGADIVIRFKAAAIGSSSTCLAECKNYTASLSGLTVSTVADKVLQAHANFDAEPVDHWILISPHLDPNNELDKLVERWNATQYFPFTVQVWSPQTGIRELFAIDPDIYRSLYGEDPPALRRDATDVIAEFSERLRPPLRMPEQLRTYVQDPRSLVGPSERDWLDQLGAQIERFGFDEKGARLSRALETEIMSVLVDSPTGSNVALLLADFGEGKSFFTVSLCIRLRNRFLGAPRLGSPIPVRLHLRGYRHVSAPADFLRTQLELLGLSMTDWAELRRGNVLVVLDGLDEMSVRQDPATARANLNRIGSLLELLEGLPVLVTSRPHFFASSTDRELFYDRLRRPHVFRMRQPDRHDTVTHLRAYADSLELAPKLNKIEGLYDPIGLAGKVLFLEMIKKTLPELPEDHFDELVLYDTYVQGSLTRKIELLRDPGSAMHDADLLDGLEKLLERIAVAIHVSGEGGVDLREFVADWGGAARLLWHASQLDPTTGDSDDDASARIGSRSLLRRAGPENEERWLVDFFHRSMKEYFIAKAFRRALNSPDPYAATRELLLKAPVQPEILGFFRLIAGSDQKATTVLASIAHSARAGSDQETLGGGAISLYHAAGGQFADSDWKSLQLDGALLTGADLSGSDFRGSTLRAADLSSADLTGTDLRSADLTGANLDAGGTIISLASDTSAHRFVCLTKDCELGWISVRADGSLRLSVISLPRTLRCPENVYILREDIILVTAQSEFLITDISSGAATEVAYFRVSSKLRNAAVVDQTLLGVIIESEYADSEALLIDINSGQTQWRIPVQANASAYGWFTHGIVVASDTQLLLFGENRNVTIMHEALEPTSAAICVRDNQAILVSEDGRETRLPLNNSGDPKSTLVVHRGAGTAVTAADGQVISSSTDGWVALTKRDAKGIPVVVARFERRLRCDGALVEAMKSDREFAIFTANGAH